MSNSENIYVDTHCHLYLDNFDKDRDKVIRRAVDAGVERMYLPNIDSSSIESMLNMEENYPGRAFPMMGLHPCSVGENMEAEIAVVEDWLGRRSFCAIGEIGTDHYWDTTFAEQQELIFRRQLEWAREMGLPVVIHSRETLDLNISIVNEMQDGRLQGVFHCFTGTPEQAKAIADIGFYMGLGGVLTFKNSGMDKVAQDIPLSRIVLETDAPYLTPTPYRGQRNESSYVPLVARKLADVKEISTDEVAQITSANANYIYKYTSEVKHL